MWFISFITWQELQLVLGVLDKMRIIGILFLSLVFRYIKG